MVPPESARLLPLFAAVTTPAPQVVAPPAAAVFTSPAARGVGVAVPGGVVVGDGGAGPRRGFGVGERDGEAARVFGPEGGGRERLRAGGRVGDGGGVARRPRARAGVGGGEGARREGV